MQRFKKQNPLVKADFDRFWNMKRHENRKEKFKQRLAEALLELVIAAVLCAIGICVYALFGKSMDEIDFELAVLIGVGVIIVPTLTVAYFVNRKRAKRNAQSDRNTSEISPENRDNPSLEQEK